MDMIQKVARFKREQERDHHAILRRVAVVYEMAIRAGEAPIVAVASELRVSQSTATRWIAEARDAGHISLQQKDARYRTAVLVADELGVDYDDLVAAIRKHAPVGRLWVGAA